jgi:lactose/L-arabinose transport system substrate-binding protein
MIGQRETSRRAFIQQSLAAGFSVGVVLSGCGGSSSGGGDAGGQVTMLSFSPLGPKIGDLVVPLYNGRYNDGKVSFRHQSIGADDIWQRLSAGFAARGKDLPDLLMIEYTRMPGYLQQFPEALANLSKLGADKHRTNFSAVAWNYCSLKNAVYALPWDIGPVGVFYREDDFAKAKVDASEVETWDQYLDATARVRRATKKRALTFTPSSDHGPLEIMLQQQGRYYFDDAGKVAVNSPETRQALDVLRRLYDGGLALSGSKAAEIALKNELVSTSMGGAWMAGSIRLQVPDQSGKWRMMRLPAFAPGGNHGSNDGGSAFAVNAASPRVKDAYRFVELAMANREVQLKLVDKFFYLPALNTTYDAPEFSGGLSEYYGNQPVMKTLIDLLPSIPNVTVTSDFGRARDVMLGVQQQVVARGADPDHALAAAAEEIARATGRDIA